MKLYELVKMICLSFLALVCGWLLLYSSIPLLVGLAAWLKPAPPEPEITYAEFDFRLDYEVDGKPQTYEDVLVCEYTGYEVNWGLGKIRTWNDYNKSTGDDSKIYLHQLDETKYITLGIGTAEYFMDDPDVDYVPDNPYISVYNSATGYYLGGTQEEIALLEGCGFKVLDWYCDPPIENTYKYYWSRIF